VNQSTASEMADEAFRGAISPLAMLLAGTSDARPVREVHRMAGVRVCLQRAERARDEETELAVQVQLLQAGVLTVNEVRAMRGLAPLGQDGVAQLVGEGTEQAG
jgi:hypothetical protein